MARFPPDPPQSTFPDIRDPFNPAGLRASCRSCNLAKRNTDVAAAAKAYRNGQTKGPTLPPGANEPNYVPRTPAEHLAVYGYDW